MLRGLNVPGSADLRSPSGKTRHDHRQLRRLNGLGDVDVEPRAEDLQAIGRTGVRGQRRHRHRTALVRGQGANPSDETVTVLFRHFDVADNQIGAVGGRGGESRFC